MNKLVDHLLHSVTSTNKNVIKYDEKTKILNGGPEENFPNSKGIGYDFYFAMKKNKDVIAQIDAFTGKSETFGSLLQRSIRTAIELKKYAKPDEIISICSENSISNFVPFIAAEMIGTIVASLDPTIPLDDTEHLLKQVKPKVIFVSLSSLELIEKALINSKVQTKLVVFGNCNKYTEFIEFSKPKSDETYFRPIEINDLFKTAVILFSSGTTGLSKGICLRHYGLLYQAKSFTSSGAVIERWMNFATTYWISTVILITLTCLYGSTRIISKFNPQELWGIIKKYNVTYMFVAPSQAISLTKSSKPKDINTSCLLDVMVAGGPFSAENSKEFQEMLPGTHIYQAYGQTEASGLITYFKPNDPNDVRLFNKKLTSCGKPMKGILYKIVNPENDEVLGPNQRGELRYSGKSRMNGYYNIDSSDAFDENGWIKSGDIAYYDEEFCFYIVDRIKEMLKFQSFHVAPAKIEGVLLSHPGVAVAVVIGIPHKEDGDHPMGLVILKPGVTITPEELVNYVESRVDNRSRLRAGVKIISSVPYTPSGKIKKNLLKQMVLSNKI